MARPTNRLSARFVRTAPAGYHADGAGLYLLVTPAGTASWVFRFTLRGRKREMGLGAATTFTLAEARERAADARRLLADGLDPIEYRRAARSAADAFPRTWGEAVEDYIARHRAGWKKEAQERQWRQSLADYGPAADTPVASVDTDAVLACLSPLWRAGGKVETASRLRGRIERIWDAEKVMGSVAGENPARWRGHLEHLLAKPSRIARKRHHPAMPFADVPALVARLAERDGPARRALRWTILTAARTDETIGATWAEIDAERALWTIPPSRMKGGEEHVVPLPAAALALLDGLPRDRPPFALSNAAMLALLQNAPPKGLGQPYTVHGFRSSFHDWASEVGDWPEHVIDQALAHKIPDAVKAAYRRGNLLAKRRELMQAWADYLAG